MQLTSLIHYKILTAPNKESQGYVVILQETAEWRQSEHVLGILTDMVSTIRADKEEEMAKMFWCV